MTVSINTRTRTLIILEISAASVSLPNCLANLPAIPRSLAVGSKSFVAPQTSFVAPQTSLIAGPLGRCWREPVAGLALRLKASVVVQVLVKEQKVGASALQEEFPLQAFREQVPARAIAEYQKERNPLSVVAEDLKVRLWECCLLHLGYPQRSTPMCLLAVKHSHLQ
jgi:hypothetical protein